MGQSKYRKQLNKVLVNYVDRTQPCHLLVMQRFTYRSVCGHVWRITAR